MKSKISLVLFIAINCLFGEEKPRYNTDILIQNLLKTDSTSIGQKINYPDTGKPEITMLKVTIPPGKETGFHKHTIPVFAYVLSGRLSVELENGKTMEFNKDSSFAEVINTIHNGKNKGNEDVVLIVTYMGEKNLPLSIRK
jgi:quercetin dioxygenase-like cupin family protein